MALKPWPRPVMEFVKFKNKQVAGLYVDDYPYVVIIKVDGVKKTASGDLGKLMTQQDWNRIFTAVITLFIKSHSYWRFRSNKSRVHNVR